MLIMYNARKNKKANPKQWVTSLKAICSITCMVILSDAVVSTLAHLQFGFLTDWKRNVCEILIHISDFMCCLIVVLLLIKDVVHDRPGQQVAVRYEQCSALCHTASTEEQSRKSLQWTQSCSWTFWGASWAAATGGDQPFSTPLHCNLGCCHVKMEFQVSELVLSAALEGDGGEPSAQIYSQPLARATGACRCSVLLRIKQSAEAVWHHEI